MRGNAFRQPFAPFQEFAVFCALPPLLCPEMGARPISEDHPADQIVRGFQIHEITKDHVANDFQAKAKLKDGPLGFLIKIIDQLGGSVFRNFTEQVQHSRRVFAKRSLKHGDGRLIAPGPVGFPHLQTGENKGSD